MRTEPDPEYIEETMRAVQRLWRAIMAIKQREGEEPDLQQLQTVVTEPGADRMLLVLECLSVLAEEVERLQQRVILLEGQPTGLTRSPSAEEQP